MVNQSNNDDSLEFESRTQKKHYAHSMVDLAHKLANFSQTQLNSLPLDNQILSAIAESKKISSHIAKKRHFQFLGKLLLKSNHQEIIRAIDSQTKQHEAGMLRTPFLTQWLENALADTSIIQQLYETHEHSDIQTLRQLLRAASKENANTKKNKRKLFEHLRNMDKQQPLP
ncbi:MAG TPA: DUF615 domain-containing protein [Oceanospirillales bacterium]|nr:DUF615 domain-containing protein [Oceanospirillales bacterium]